MQKISTGASFLDTFLGGGYECGSITTLFGPPGSGKTNLCLLAAVHSAMRGKKVLFIDTEGGIAVERIKQLCQNREQQYRQVLEKIFFFHPETFNQQRDIFSKFGRVVSAKTGIIVVDSLSSLYRLELRNDEDMYEAHSALGGQIALLLEIARKKNVPIICTAQIYDDFRNPRKVKPVGGDVLKYGSKCLLELQKQNNCCSLIVRKHRSLPEGKECRFRFVQAGMKEM